MSDDTVTFETIGRRTGQSAGLLGGGAATIKFVQEGLKHGIYVGDQSAKATYVGAAASVTMSMYLGEFGAEQGKKIDEYLSGGEGGSGEAADPVDVEAELEEGSEPEHSSRLLDPVYSD